MKKSPAIPILLALLSGARKRPHSGAAIRNSGTRPGSAIELFIVKQDQRLNSTAAP